MRWRQASEIARVDGRDAIIILRDGSELSEEDFSRDALDDLLRSALSLGVSLRAALMEVDINIRGIEAVEFVEDRLDLAAIEVEARLEEADLWGIV